jgi:hypothetical protein
MTGLPHRMRNAAVNYLRRLSILRARSYRRVFSLEALHGRDAEIVLADLRDFAFAETTTFHVEPLEAARRQGRREVWLRIARHLNLDEAKVQKLVELEDDDQDY